MAGDLALYPHGWGQDTFGLINEDGRVAMVALLLNETIDYAIF